MADPDAGAVRLTVRFYAGAAAAAGCTQEQVELPAGAELPDLVAELVRRHGDRLAAVLPAATFLIDEVAGRGSLPLDGARDVDVLPPFAGG